MTIFFMGSILVSGDPSPALFAQGQVAVLQLPRTSSL